MLIPFVISFRHVSHFSEIDSSEHKKKKLRFVAIVQMVYGRLCAYGRPKSIDIYIQMICKNIEEI